MATRTKGKSVVSGRPGIIDHQNNPTNTRLVDDQHGRNLIRKNFHPRLSRTGPPQLPHKARPLKTPNKSMLPKFCIFKMDNSGEMSSRDREGFKMLGRRSRWPSQSLNQPQCKCFFEFLNVLQRTVVSPRHSMHFYWLHY